MKIRWWRKSKSQDLAGPTFNIHDVMSRAGLFGNSVRRSVDDMMDNYWAFNNVGYQGTPTAMSLAKNQEGIENNFESFVTKILKANSVVWACEQRRLNVCSEARFQYRRINDGRPGELHGSPASRLSLLDTPWTNGTTGDLITKMMLHADFAGNAYVTRTSDGTQLRLLRPDWVYILMGSHNNPSVTADDIDAEIIAYAYFPGGLGKYGESRPPVILLPDQVAHFAPMPDPLAHYRGMSWLTPLMYELQGDEAANMHKNQFFRNGATLQYVVSLDKDISEDAFNRFVGLMNAQTKGLANSYKTLYLGGGADVKTVGADLSQLDFKAVQGAGETRIAAAAGVPPIIVGLSEGLAASTYSNYGQAKRAFIDGTVRPILRNISGSLSTLVVPPAGSELWYDDRDIQYFREDELDRAKIAQIWMDIMSSAVMAGWEPEAAVRLPEVGDFSPLVGHHTGLFSVQLQPPLTAEAVAAGVTRPPLNGRQPEVATPPPSNGKPAKTGTRPSGGSNG